MTSLRPEFLNGLPALSWLMFQTLQSSSVRSTINSLCPLIFAFCNAHLGVYYRVCTLFIIPYSDCTLRCRSLEVYNPSSVSTVSSFVSLTLVVSETGVGRISVSIIHAGGICQALVWLMVRARVMLVRPHPKHLLFGLTKASTLLCHVRVPALTIVQLSYHGTRNRFDCPVHSLVLNREETYGGMSFFG